VNPVVAIRAASGWAAPRIAASRQARILRSPVAQGHLAEGALLDHEEEGLARLDDRVGLLERGPGSRLPQAFMKDGISEKFGLF
jgi:hypothetical protein